MINHNPSMEANMKTSGLKLMCTLGRKAICGLAAVLAFCVVANAAAPVGRQTSFATPELAASALIAATKSGDLSALIGILGNDAKPLLESGDPVADRAGRERFVKSYEEGSKLAKSGESKTLLLVGKDEWLFPIPLVKEVAGWRFDTRAGKEEILNRRIGRNELSTIQAALAYVDAQREYYRANPQRDKFLQYAKKFVSTQGMRDGLYFPAKAGEQPSPLGELYVSARAAGYSGKAAGAGAPTSYHGYHYRILHSQGSDAPGGAYDYTVQGKMIGGHALVAWPATYGNSGVMTFMVNHDGVVYEKDLGPHTAAEAQKITQFNPDKTWKAVKEGI